MVPALEVNIPQDINDNIVVDFMLASPNLVPHAFPMRSTATSVTHPLLLLWMIGLGSLSAMQLFPASALASSSSAADSSSEWTTTHSEEPTVAPKAQGGAQAGSTSRAARSQTSGKPSAAQGKGTGTGAMPSSRKTSRGNTKEAKPEPIGIQLEQLFRGIGADLEEFFVGTRTVDKDD